MYKILILILLTEQAVDFQNNVRLLHTNDSMATFKNESTAVFLPRFAVIIASFMVISVRDRIINNRI